MTDPATAVTFGTRVWLAELLRAGWDATVSEYRPVVGRYRMPLADDLEEAVREVRDGVQVGVLLTREDENGVFIPCPSEAAARVLLEEAWAEVDP